MTDSSPARLDRRTTIKWVLAAAASVPLLKRVTWNAGAASPSAAPAKGYGTDPDLRRIYSPGELWPLTLTPELQRTAAALCDVIIPPDAHSPGAASVGVVDFIDEWISAPYPRHQRDQALIVPGLVWIEGEAKRRYAKLFAALSAAKQSAICDQICYAPEVPASLAEVATFFARYRDLTAGGFYTTPPGHRDLRYVGNVALASFDGPPAEVLARVGLDQ